MEIFVESMPILLGKVRKAGDVHVVLQIINLHLVSDLIFRRTLNEVSIALTFFTCNGSDSIDDLLRVLI
jgi:hypothetical protein